MRYIASVLLLLGSLCVLSAMVSGRLFIVDDDGGADYDTIQEALDNAKDGDLIVVKPGTYIENLHVGSQIELIGSGNTETIIDGGYQGTVVTINADGVTISGFSIVNSSDVPGDAGVLITSDNNIIIENYITNCRSGIYPKESSGNIIENNSCVDNTLHGITFGYANSDFNMIKNNVFGENEKYGMYLGKTDGNEIIGNVFRNNDGLYGALINSTSNCTVRNNTFMGNEYGVRLMEVMNVIFSENRCENNSDAGIWINATTDLTVKYCTITNNSIGIRVNGKCKNTIINMNTITGNQDSGLDGTESEFKVDARLNYWGAISGPHHPTENVDGTGDIITSNTQFNPWATSVPVPPDDIEDPDPDTNGDDDQGNDDDEDAGPVVVGMLVGILVVLSAMLLMTIWSILMTGPNEGKRR